MSVVDPRHRAHPAGFTILEVVLALVIFSLMTVMVYGAFFIGHRAVYAGERQADVNQRMRMAEELIGRQIRSAVLYYARYEDDQIPFFFGQADAVSFVTAAPQGRGGHGLAVVTYRVVDGKLYLEERSIFTPEDLYLFPADVPVQRAMLLADFTALRFEYLPREDLDAQWQAAWDARDEDGLPAAIRLTITGLPFFGGNPWLFQVPIFTTSYGFGIDEFAEPPEDTSDEDLGDDDDAGTDQLDDDTDEETE